MWRVRGTSVVIDVLDLGLACCAVETAVAFATRPDLFEELAGGSTVGDAGRVLLVSGTVTDRLVPAIRQAAERLGPNVRVISFGSCANTGGPYWDSYSVAKGIDQFLPVVRYVPGCAPPPEALIATLLEIAGEPT
jgi:NADH-quinone oxidoreductase subunit B